MDYNDIVSVLGYAGDNEYPVRIRTTGKLEVIGVPTAVDPHVAAHEALPSASRGGRDRDCGFAGRY